MEKANAAPMQISVDPLNVMQFDVPSLSGDLLKKIAQGKEKRTQVLDGSQLPQHENLVPYAQTHVDMHITNEDDIVRCVRLLQWSDERMRSRATMPMAWAWEMAWREGDHIYFAVSWYSKAFFDKNSEAFGDPNHQGYLGLFGLKPEDLKIRHEILNHEAPQGSSA